MPTTPFTITIHNRTFRLIPHYQGGAILDAATGQVLRSTTSREQWRKWIGNAVRVSAGMAVR